MKYTMNPLLLTDFYKVGHIFQYPDGIEKVYSNLTARKSRIEGIDKTVFFGLQYFIKEYLVDRFQTDFFDRPKEEVMAEYKRLVENTIGPLPSYKHIEDLHDLGYLPIKIKALPEGSRVPIGVPMLTIVNTKDEFFWLTNFIESIMSAAIWMPITAATLAYEYRQVFDKVLNDSVGDSSFADFMGHDFSFRGMEGLEGSYLSGMGHLTSFKGTDTIPAIMALEAYYNANVENELVGTSVPATEHSVMSAGTGVHGEFETFRELVQDKYPSGIISIVSDTFDLWKVLTDFMPRLKDVIMARSGADINKVVIRPDSGDPVDIICGLPPYTDITLWNGYEYPTQRFTLNGEAYEIDGGQMRYLLEEYGEYTHEEAAQMFDQPNHFINWSGGALRKLDMKEPEIKGVVELLWDTFGGEVVNGYKVLHPSVGAIYGDSITIDRAKQISKRLMVKGFAPILVYGIGSYTYQYNTRDTFGMAVKCTAVQHKGKWVEVFKDPITDDGTKKSLKGLISIGTNVHGEYEAYDQVKKEVEEGGAFQTVYEDGRLLVDHKISDIRTRLLNE